MASVKKDQITCLGCLRNLLGILLLCVALTAFGGIVLVPCLLIIITVLFNKAIASAIKNKVRLLVNVIAMILDPLLFYIPVLNDKKKCIHWDKTLGITATVLRSVLDSVKFVCIIRDLGKECNKQHEEYNKNHKEDNKNQQQAEHNKNQEKNLNPLQRVIDLIERGEFLEDPTVRKWMLFVIDSLAILPIPQVLVIFGIRGTGFSMAMTFFVLQYSLRVIRTYFLFTDAIEVSGILADATRSIFAFYLLLYLQSGHMFGAIWYNYAIEKATECWREACKNHTGCSSHSSFSCNKSFRDYNFLNDFCPISTGSTTGYSFGLYNDALQSGIVEETNFSKKLLRSLRWGLQNLSAFGQNLQTSTDVGENIFAICMTNYGVVLFVFLIGRMQTETARSQKITQMWQGIRKSNHYDDISGDQKVVRKFREAKRKRLLNKHAGVVRIDSLVNDLPDELGSKIKPKLFIKLIKNVKEFENWDENLLGYLSEYLKPVFFIERTRIIREGDPIDEMLFVLKGKLWSYTSRNVTTTTTSNNRRSRENNLKGGKIFGKELIAWAQDESSSNIPISTKTIQALTDVEAFTLMADDLKHVLSLRVGHCDRAALFLQSYWRYRKFLRERKDKQKSCLGRVLDWAARCTALE